MGVPAFFRWLSRKYPSIIVSCTEEKVSEKKKGVWRDGRWRCVAAAFGARVAWARKKKKKKRTEELTDLSRLVISLARCYYVWGERAFPT